MSTWRNIFKFPGEKDAFTLRQTFRLDDESASLSFGFAFKVGPKFMVLNWKHPRKGEEVVLVGEFFPHTH